MLSAAPVEHLYTPGVRTAPGCGPAPCHFVASNRGLVAAFLGRRLRVAIHGVVIATMASAPSGRLDSGQGEGDDGENSMNPHVGFACLHFAM